MDRITPQPSTVSSQRPHFLMSIDVEDWFQVENFKPYIGFDSWPSRELRVEANTDRLLRLFQEARPGPEGSPHRDNGPVKATFFVLGWLAERLPGLIRRIAEQGHEIASHGFAHALNYQFTDQDLDQDLETSKKLLEDVSGTPVLGYRAPTFSINNRILARIKACGYRYDSSYNSVGLFQRCGTLDLPPAGAGTLALRLSPGFFELPISNLA
ncbi:MAG: polysaccharide deacetylase family protein, partial [Desulfohalobiaceae bacterium]|nr:polysaccharide deacetylase family protein [Desulfohalobiaceae bacterium]